MECHKGFVHCSPVFFKGGHSSQTLTMDRAKQKAAEEKAAKKQQRGQEAQNQRGESRGSQETKGRSQGRKKKQALAKKKKARNEAPRTDVLFGEWNTTGTGMEHNWNTTP